MGEKREEGERILGEKAEVSYDRIDAFFDERSNNDSMKHKYNYVMYLDDTPEVAIERDRQCKEKVKSLLRIESGMRVFDVGCGVGRWGELFCKEGCNYVGVDGSPKMIERAKDNLYDYNNKELFVGKVQELEAVLNENHIDGTFDIIIMSGVLMYINDEDVRTILKSFTNLIHEGSQICIIESMSNDERLTLKDIYSEELKQRYSAIYRSVDEFMEMMGTAFADKLENKCNYVLDFSDGLQKRREHVTMEHCVIWQAK